MHLNLYMSSILSGVQFRIHITSLSMLVTLCLGAIAHAASLNCEALLARTDYREGNQITLDPGLSVLSRRPESGSLENRYPGVAKAIVAVMNGRMPYFRWAHARPLTDVDAVEIISEFRQVSHDIKSVSATFNLNSYDKDRFNSVTGTIQEQIQAAIKNYSSFALTSDKINTFTGLALQIQASLFELFVSTFIDGEKFWFHQNVLEFYRGPNVKSSGRIKRHKGEHEIDIVIRRRNGKEMWVEVKNNAMDWTVEDYASWAGILPSQLSDNMLQFFKSYDRSRSFGMNGSILDQLRVQLQTREDLNKNRSVELMLISKFPISAEQHIALTNLGVQSWSIYFSSQAFLPQYFHAISKQIAP